MYRLYLALVNHLFTFICVRPAPHSVFYVNLYIIIYLLTCIQEISSEPRFWRMEELEFDKLLDSL